MDDSWSSLVVFLLGDPHLLEGGKRRQDRASDPNGVLSFWRSDDLYLHGGGSHAGDFLLHAVGDTGVHRGTTGQDCVRVEVLTDIDIALHDGVEATFLDADDLHSQEGWAEHRFGAAETLVTNRRDLSVGQLVGLFDGGGGGGGGHLRLEIESDVAELLLDVADDLTLGGRDHGVSSLGHDLHEVVGQVASGQVETQDGVRKGETLVDGDGMGDAIADVEDETGGATGSVKGEDGLNTDVHGRVVEGLEADLRHLLSIRLRVERRLGVECWGLIGRDSQLVGVGVVPDLLHVVPVGDDAVFDGILQGEDTSL